MPDTAGEEREAMMAEDDTVRYLCLLDELETSKELLKSGFGHLQEIDMGNTFYHLPHQLLASGFERLMKCYIAVVDKGRDGAYPDGDAMRADGHDLGRLLEKIRTNYYGGTQRPLLRQDLAFIKTDSVLNDCMRILSLFGKKGRYYNLNVVAGARHEPMAPKDEWEALESRVEDPTPYHGDQERLHRDYYPRVNSTLIAKMERLVRAIAMQFTLGGHADPRGEIRRLSCVYRKFRNLRDDQFGTSDYRRSVEILRGDADQWIRRSAHEIAGSCWPSVAVTKAEFGDEWPFRDDRVIVECRDDLFCIVNVGGYDFALNGAARSRFGLPCPHEAGMAVLGKSVGPFIEMARGLSSSH
ncbi:MAG: hypothetical protein F4205_11605 [Gemmatimonadetes bacterium]|nr:hypothetical protein [Gemmatimonadota bacterium]MYG36128.1 hypothetical protein [Gemmatimonadota bacterium]